MVETEWAARKASYFPFLEVVVSDVAEGLYSFPVVSATNYHKLGGL